MNRESDVFILLSGRSTVSQDQFMLVTRPIRRRLQRIDDRASSLERLLLF